MDGGGGWLGGAPSQACTCMCGKHGNFMQIAAAIGEIPGNSL